MMKRAMSLLPLMIFAAFTVVNAREGVLSKPIEIALFFVACGLTYSLGKYQPNGSRRKHEGDDRSGDDDGAGSR